MLLSDIVAIQTLKDRVSFYRAYCFTKNKVEKNRKT